MIHPRKPVPANLLSPSAPMLCIEDKRRDLGDVARAGVCLHDRDDFREYDGRRLLSRRAYLQCVLETKRTREAGCQAFSSQGSEAYFKALLKDPAHTAAGQTAQQYKPQLARLAGNDLPTLPAPRPPRPAPVEIVAGDFFSDGEGSMMSHCKTASLPTLPAVHRAIPMPRARPARPARAPPAQAAAATARPVTLQATQLIATSPLKSVACGFALISAREDGIAGSL